MHIKRQKIPKSWPIKRKGSKYIVRPSFGFKKGIPILIILRDILEIAQNRKEVKKAIREKKILINGKPIIDEKQGTMIFDVITLVGSNKNYRLGMGSNGKFKLNEINSSEAESKISKVINKKILKGKKVQLNLYDGRNILSDVKCKINDSVVISLKDKKIKECIELKEKSSAIVFSGKHIGEKGVINKIDKKHKIAELSVSKKPVKVLIKQLMVIKEK